jgi:hypothetical protein
VPELLALALGRLELVLLVLLVLLVRPVLMRPTQPARVLQVANHGDLHRVHRLCGALWVRAACTVRARPACAGSE